MAKTEKLAYVTLLSTASYLPGVLALARSLRRYGQTQHPLVCVCSKGVPVEALETLRREGIESLVLAQEAAGGKFTPPSTKARATAIGTTRSTNCCYGS